ncbi:hypothetical protein WR25_02489 [Diploscapter pachys]|uniref:Innexin n=1 Tax=Diploscapter pachys TaxID=2018661 RepID=A0A2A2KNQ3_9BILA|nr:hypothetical protein WR25_02489 [Diploscapter pachys]
MSTASLMDRAISTWFKPVGIEDIIDKLNYLWTASLIGFFSLLVFTMQYGGSPIHCIVPSEHYFSMKQVVESYCYISSTYAVPLEKDIPRETSEREQTQINYFRWVPFMLLLQAFCFHIPSWLWNWLHDHSGIDLIFLTEDAKNLRGLMSEDRKALVKKLSNYMLERLGIGEQHLAPIRIFCFKGHHGSFMVVAYHIVKACYVVNAYLQLHCIKKFLGANDTFWATQV